MAARGTERCRICNSPLTADGQCPDCGHNKNVKGKKPQAEKKDNASTAENKPVQGQILARKKPPRRAFLLNQTTAERYEVSNDVTRIGRDRSNKIAFFEDKYVSRHHAWILQAQGSFWLEDLGSTNATLLNGKPVKERSKLSTGDKLTFGKTELIFFADN